MTASPQPTLLVLADGTTFEGEAVGATPPGGIVTGEVVFNTVMAGYQEVLSDPSYAGQIVTFTYPHLGNYGVNPDDEEARRPFCRGVIMRDLVRRPSGVRSEGNLDAWLVERNLAGISGIDTRRLTRHIRDAGAMPGAFGTADETELKAAAAREPGTDGVDLVATVTCDQPYEVSAAADAPGRRIVALDFGIKTTILRHLAPLGSVQVVPATTEVDQILAAEPDGVFLSNGPGDPSAVAIAATTISELLDRVPVFGICLGHQLLSTALGAGTYKLPFGHHGGNHPVRDLETGRIDITSQNHNYCVADQPIDGATITHRNLNDGTIEGLSCPDLRAFSVQYHPEAGPGPHDAAHLFDRFAQLMGASR